ncbi:SH3 domain-containing protein [Bacillus sp. N9]
MANYSGYSSNYRWETKFLQEKLDAPDVAAEEAQEIVVAFMKDWKVIPDKVETANEVVTTTPNELTLKPEYDGGNIRERAHQGAKIITSINRNETVLFLGEEMLDDENRVWYKVQTKTNFTGWISSSIVE